ncbi:MAG: hypothetical protein M1366_02245 [Patescibacteria group bacterium]|nr:hypothetical protein [Patescibacteria group bacterium]
MKDEKYKKTIDLLVLSEELVDYARKESFFIGDHVESDYSYLLSPADKAFEGALQAIARKRGFASDEEIKNYIPMENLFYDYYGQPARAKQYVLEKKNERYVNTIWNRYYFYRDKLLHFEPGFFIYYLDNVEYDLADIEKTIKLAYKLFIGNPDKL